MADTEGYRKSLRLAVDFANVRHAARTILVTSAVEKEGKSTTAANLALAYAGTGRRVALVDLDLRRPTIGKFFGLDESRVGATDVALGSSELADAMVSFTVGAATPGRSGDPESKQLSTIWRFGRVDAAASSRVLGVGRGSSDGRRRRFPGRCGSDRFAADASGQRWIGASADFLTG